MTLRAVNGSPGLRNLAVAKEIGKVLKRRARRELPCRVVHFSIQHDHIHLIVEAEDRVALSRGVQGLASGIARVVNRTTGCSGLKLWRDRYHARPLTTPREVRTCLVYVLAGEPGAAAPFAPARRRPCVPPPQSAPQKRSGVPAPPAERPPKA